MSFIDQLIEYKKTGEYEFTSTAGATVKALLPSTLTDIKKNFNKFTRLIGLLSYYVNDTVDKLNTKVMIQSFVRKLVKERYGDESKQYKHLQTAFSMSSSEKKERESIAEKKVSDSNRNQIEITTSKIKEFILELQGSRFQIVPAIILAQLVCGSRLIEILSKEITFTEGKNNHIIQSDVAKNATGTPREVRKPVLFMNPTQFLNLMNMTRKRITYKSDDTNIELSNRYGKRVNAKILSISKKVGLTGITSSHDLRKIYAALSYKKFGSSSEVEFYKTVLGHKDYSSVANYSTIKVI